MCACPGAHKPLGNNATCEIACYGNSSGGGSGDYRGAEEAGRNARRWFDCNVLGKGCDEGANQPSPGHALNELGVQAYNKGDWATALAYFERAIQQDPNDPVMRKNLANARENLEAQQRKEKVEREAMEQLRRNKAAADNMQQSIQSFSQTLNAAPVSGGLDFDGRTAESAPSNGQSGGLDFTASVPAAVQAKRTSAVPANDPKVVDARNVPPGLPPAVDSAIAGAFVSAPAGVSDRVRKGFQAGAAGDWLAAQAWFADALSRDPSNAALQNLMVAARSGAAPAPVAQAASLPRDEVADLYHKGYEAVIAGDRPGAIAAFEAAMRRDPGRGGSIGTYVAYLRATSKPTPPGLQLPQDSDQQYLFDSTRPPAPAPKPTPTFIIGSDGQLIQVPENSDQKSTTYIKGKDGELMAVPQRSDIMIFSPATTPASPPRPVPVQPATAVPAANPFLKLLLDALTGPEKPGKSKAVGSARG